MTICIAGSLARIADFDRVGYEVAELPQHEWQGGDYVIGEVTGDPSPLFQVEKISGRLVKAWPGDRIIGALGRREATLEGVGSWESIRNGEMHALTGAAVFGSFTSMSKMLPLPMSLAYRGHIVRGGRKVCMRDFALRDCGARLTAPVVLLVGTSMSAGKTTTGFAIIHELAACGLRVAGAKLTGAGRYRDILSFADAGAVAVYDFVDAGLPSTVVPEAEFLAAIRPLIAKVGSVGADVVVVEAGASPLEPYNGAAAIAELGEQVRCTVLCAYDPYGVVGVHKAFGLKPDMVSGPAAGTSAAISLVQKLSGVPAINVMDPSARPALRALLARALALDLGAGRGGP